MGDKFVTHNTRKNMFGSNNDRLSGRNVEDAKMMTGDYGSTNHNKNVQRLLLERGAFNQNSQSPDLDDDAPEYEQGRIGKKSSRKVDFGEITGQNHTSDKFAAGMPLRSHYSVKKSEHNENKHVDFNLYENDDENDNPKDYNISYNDPGGENATWSNVQTSMNSLTSQVQTKAICKNGIESINFFLLNNMITIMNKSFIINGLGLYSIFGSLYINAKGNTEIELKNYFSYPKKDILYEGVKEIMNKMTDVSKHIRMSNFLIFSNEITYNTEMHDIMRPLTDLKCVDIRRPQVESNNINNIIYKIIGKKMKNMVVPENLHNLDIILLNTAVINPIWNVAFNGIKLGLFNNVMKMNFMYTVGKPFNLFEDSTIQLLELECVGNKLAMGFIKTNEMIDSEKIEYCINNFKSTLMDEVIIPIFKTNTKIRYTNILQQTDLKTVFLDLNVPNLFDDQCKITDVIQNIEVIVTNNTIPQRVPNKGFKSSKKFILNTSFIYYIRNIQLNNIIMIGFFQG